MMLTETITWHPVAEGLPDDGIAVLVATKNCEEPVWLGFLDGEQWRDVDATAIEVTHWADIPKGAT